MNSYPADAAGIMDIERGRTCQAVVPSPVGGSLSAGETVVFVLAESRGGQEPAWTKDGDSVRVLLTGVSELDKVDPATGRALLQLTWEPLGQAGPPGRMTRRNRK